MEVEYCIRGDAEEIRNFLHRMKRTVDKGWANDLNGIEAAHHAAEREAQGSHSMSGIQFLLLDSAWSRFLC